MGIRTAILGYGRSGGKMHAGAIERNKAFEMVAACDIDPERRKQAAERFGCAVYDDYHVVLDKEPLDLVVVVTRSDQHCQMTCDCLSAGVSVLVTKPWAINEAEARRMVAAAEAASARNPRTVLLPWLPARWACDLRRLKRLIGEKTIGNVFLVRRVVSSFATRCDWQTQRRHGGGYLLNWGPHIIDPPILLLDGEVKSVYGRMKQTINPGDVEDLFLAVMELDNGAVVQAEFTISAVELPSWFIQGDRGTVVVHGSRMKTHCQIPARPDDPTKVAAMKSPDPEPVEETIEGALYGDEDEIYREIAQAIRGERPFPVAPADALELTRVLDAIRTSSEENRVVHL